MVAVKSCMAATTHTVPSTEHARLMTVNHVATGPGLPLCSQDTAAIASKLPAAPHTVAATTTRDTGMLLARVNAAAMIPQHAVTE